MNRIITAHDRTAIARRIAAPPRLLVACDYDGTLAELVDDPSQAWPRADAISACCDLALAVDTHVAVISGRSRADLRRLSGLPSVVHLVGSHGREFADDRVDGLDRSGLERLDRIAGPLLAIVGRIPGAMLERKPAALVLHHRTVARDRLAELMHLVDALDPSLHRTLYMSTGKDVIEFAVVPPDKGAALDRLRASLAVDAVLVIGDDVTDESAFARLRPGDIGVKVGDGPTRATHRLRDPAAVAALLGELAVMRTERRAGAAAIATLTTSP